MRVELRAAREASGKTQAQVAKDVGLSESQYQRIEYDKSEPGVRTAIRIAQALGTETWSDFCELFGAATPTAHDQYSPAGAAGQLENIG